MTPGIYPGLPMREYLEINALSATPLRTMFDECPLAGWFESRLNPDRPNVVSEIMDTGTIAHSILLEGSTASIAVIDPKDYPAATTGAIPKGWTNKGIQAARDEARCRGLQPILADDMQEVWAMIEVAKAFIESLRNQEKAIWHTFQPDGGQSEVTMVWDDDGTLCKLRCDRIGNDYGIVTDYKTTGASVEPDHFGRAGLIGLGYGFSAAFYQRGIKKLTGVDAAFFHLCQETSRPYLCSLVGMDPTWCAYAGAKVASALNMWKRCVQEGQWDGYPNRACYPELPAWENTRLEEKLIQTGIPYDIGKMFERTDGK